MPKILAFAGSARKDSVNKKLIRIAADKTREAGGDVTLIDLRDYPMPLYDGDLEASDGLPENAEKLYKLFLENDGLLLACPEYNSSITPLWKNTIDWVSRPRPNEPRLAAFQNKTAGLLAASPGALGGLRGLVHVRSILGNIGVLVIPNQLAVPKAYDAFADDGTLQDEGLVKKIAAVTKELVETTARLVSS